MKNELVVFPAAPSSDRYKVVDHSAFATVAMESVAEIGGTRVQCLLSFDVLASTGKPHGRDTITNKCPDHEYDSLRHRQKHLVDHMDNAV